MSGISGIFYRDGSLVDRNLIKKMNQSIAHRGRDGSQVIVEGSLGLGHQMLWTTPESLQEKLPLSWKRYIITADARIDNRAELSAILNLEDSEHISDSFFILKAYQKWGEECTQHLLGDFAFALYDLDRENLFCARDHMGVKPFFYYIDNDIMLFASEIKAIKQVLKNKPSINPLAIAQHLAGYHDDLEITFFEKIYRLAPANQISLNDKEFFKKEYWKLDPSLELPPQTAAEYEEQFLEIFKEAVQCRLRSAFPLGSTLSGGLDSVSVLCTAKLLSEENDPLYTYSLIFPDVTEVDESFYINAVLEEIDVEANLIRGDNVSPLFKINDRFWLRDSPTVGPNSFLDMNLYQNIYEDGVRILLSGLDGNNVISNPYNYISELFFNLKFNKMHQEIKSLSQRLERNYGYYLKRYILPHFIPKFFKNRENPSHIIKKSFSKDNEFIFEKNVSKKFKTLKEAHYSQLTQGVIQLMLEEWESIGSTFSVEPRHPFFDKRMVEFCYGLPPDQKLKNGWDRYILRRVMENIVPKKVQWRRSKSNLSPNFKRSLLLFEEETLEKIVHDTNSNLSKYVDLNKLKKVYLSFKDEGKFAYPIWLNTTFSLWMSELDDKFFD